MSESPRPIPIAGPWITDLEIDAVTQAASTGWYEGASGWTERFEAGFAAAVERAHAVSLPSCTSALHLALSGLGVGPGDEVIVPESTWIATVAPVTYVGATPVFVDVDPETWCLSPSAVASALTPRTRAAIGVDLYGGMAAWPDLLALAAEREILLIEDAAEAIGSTCEGRPAGAFGIASAFSFHGSKTLTTGEGGMLVTDDERLLDRALRLRDHGRAPGDTGFFNDEIGFKYKMTALQAALGWAQLERLDELVERKRQIFTWYAERLAGLPGVSLNAEPPGVRSTYWMTTLVLAPECAVSPEALTTELRSIGASTRPFFHPLSSLPAFAGHPSAAGARSRNPVAYSLARRALNLPSALRLTEGEVARVCDVVERVLAAR